MAAERYLHGRGRAARLCSTVTRWSRGRGVAVMPADHVHFNGSVNLGDAESVMREIARGSRPGCGASRTARPGTGATGSSSSCRSSCSCPGWCRTGRSARRTGSTSSYRSSGRPKGSIRSVTWPDIGYAEAYLESYRVFARLRADGVIPPASASRSSTRRRWPRSAATSSRSSSRCCWAPYERAMFADLDRLLAAIPPGEVAVQWDVAVEFGVLEEAWAPAARRLRRHHRRAGPVRGPGARARSPSACTCATGTTATSTSCSPCRWPCRSGW